MTLYHGSTELIKDKLIPIPSNIMNNESVVFATDQLWLAALFIPRLRDDDIEIGFINNERYIREQSVDAFDLLRVSGYIYEVDQKYFHADKRVGMQDREFVSSTEVPILKTYKIKNIFQFVAEKGIAMYALKKKEQGFSCFSCTNIN